MFEASPKRMAVFEGVVVPIHIRRSQRPHEKEPPQPDFWLPLKKIALNFGTERSALAPATEVTSSAGRGAVHREIGQRAPE